jgi:hypothetical protein
MQIHMHNQINKSVNTTLRKSPPASLSVSIKILTSFYFQKNFHTIDDKSF